MQLRSIHYYEFDGDKRYWKLNKASLGSTNLLIAKNATGKSRSLNIITALSDIICGNKYKLESGTWVAEFVDEEDSIYVYEISFDDKNVIAEKLIKTTSEGENIILLIRNKKGLGEVYYDEDKHPKNFQIKLEKVAIARFDDEIQHSDISKVAKWANGVYHYTSATIVSSKITLSVNLESEQFNINDRDITNTPKYFYFGVTEFKEEYIDQIIRDMKALNYDLTKIELLSSNVTGNAGLGTMQLISVREKDLKANVFQNLMSDGMYRAFSLLTQLNYRIRKKSISCMLLDDIGEGLDYDRSAALIQLLVNKATDNNIQLLMATNNLFAMNAVDLKYVTILNRIGHEVDMLSIRTHPKLFEKFDFTGMSNFDLLSTDYLLQ